MSPCDARGWVATVARPWTAASHVTVPLYNMQTPAALSAHTSLLICIERALRTYFSSDQSVHDAEEPARFRAQMLHIDDHVDSGDDEVASVTVRDTLEGIPRAAYVTQLAVILCAWHETGAHPLLSLLTGSSTAGARTATIEGVTPEFTSRERVLAVPIGVVRELIATIERGVEEATLAAVTSLVEMIGGSRGILTLLGFQQTVGSRNVPPLTLCQCLAAFTQRHTPNEPLMVGARAFSKHCARSASGWWGTLEGNDHAKNARAEKKVRELLACATWKNIHCLPHAHATMEIRNALGYGARWDAETQTFRGFLEPPMANGHETKWRH
ncbi:unnamed protein product [Hyaloperonospora brassicae]|uniref:RxLR effector candidate protein n=1 Tax=Hyaloperonospora brassicae TaxID=162125 RepID=A0AAV0U4N3_HYABA|nr:unnamed protein product [Hyaloperonospora brassicae]